MNRLRSTAQKTFQVIRNLMNLCKFNKKPPKPTLTTTTDPLLSASLALKYHNPAASQMSLSPSLESIHITMSSCDTLSSETTQSEALLEIHTESRPTTNLGLMDDSLCLDQLFQEPEWASNWDLLLSVAQMLVVKPREKATICSSVLASEEASTIDCPAYSELRELVAWFSGPTSHQKYIRSQRNRLY